ncbi:OprD family outer membrane porin [Sulfurovum sp.]|uniref:OprD family outer membrane porin n=1 Tax=Sulfurovum sp. TaxID=1969726 RepID=UPI0025D53292|nr:OprD family outer membrane porin [Sulfurovum sp.]
MNKVTIKISVATAAALLLNTMAIAGGDIVPMEPIVDTVKKVKKDKPKRQTRGNMTVKYNVLPGSVDSVGDMFSEGIFYGRLRSNTFYWDWSDEDYETGGKRKDNKNMGVGGSLIYKTAILNGFSGTFGYYGSLNPDFFRMDDEDVKYSKAGKDTFSRYKVKKTGSYGIHALGQAYLEYNNGTFDVKAGRQLFESVFTASNDTKMIPNAFDGITVSAKVAPKTKVRAAWFGKQKLRDHENAHDVVTFKDSNGESWNNNDDSAVHKGLSYANFLAAGEDTNHDLFLADLQTKYVDNLVFKLSYLQVPGVVKDIVAEAHYKIPFENGWALRPGVRYFYQMDDGGGAVAGYTNLTGKAATGYDAGVADSLDSSLFAARLDLKMPDKKGFFRLGYSKVEDKADIVAPWRGFPTGGFTRAMAQYNWYANTETFLARAVYQFTPDFKASLRYAVQDFDDSKDNVQADSTIWHLDTWYNFTDRFQMKTRIGIVQADDDIAKSLGGTKGDVSYNEYRLEFNYLF